MPKPFGSDGKSNGNVTRNEDNRRRRRRYAGESSSQISGTTIGPSMSYSSGSRRNILTSHSTDRENLELSATSSVITTQPAGSMQNSSGLVAGALGVASVASTLAAAVIGVSPNSTIPEGIASGLTGNLVGSSTRNVVSQSAVSALTSAVTANNDGSGSGLVFACMFASFGVALCGLSSCYAALYFTRREALRGINRENSGISPGELLLRLLPPPPPYSSRIDVSTDAPPPYSSNDDISNGDQPTPPPSYRDIFAMGGGRNAGHYSGPDSPPPYGEEIELQVFSDDSGRGGLDEVVVTQPASTRSSVRLSLGSRTNSPERTSGGNYPQRHFAPTR